MITVDIIYKYFNDLTPVQRERIDALFQLYKYWNERINVISRKDSDNLYLHHVLHSMAIAKVMDFQAGKQVMDIGCGGGFPGIPLAILFPEVHFVMVDSIGKKIKVVQEVAKELGLTNVEAHHCRVEQLSMGCDYVVSRAVTALEDFMPLAWDKISSGEGHGILYLKGGDLQQEIEQGIARYKKGIKGVELFDISDLFDEEFFLTKKVLYIKKG